MFVAAKDDKLPLDLSYTNEKAILAAELTNLPADYHNPPANRVQLYNIHKKLVALSQCVYASGLRSGRIGVDHGCYEFQVMWRDCMESFMPDITELVVADKNNDRLYLKYYDEYNGENHQEQPPASYSNICELTSKIYKHLECGFPPAF